MKIAYSGIEGAFAHIVARRVFPDDEPVSFSSFKETYDAVASGKCDYAVMPIDNSYSGEVTEVMDLIFEGDLYINAMYSLPVIQNLLGVPGSTKGSVKKVVSHPKALEQCDEYIRSKGYEMIQASNTARAAREVARRNDPAIAAIASIETADIYGLTVLDERINESDDNTTRFVILSAKRGCIGRFEEDESFIMLFTVDNKAGALLSPLQTIARYDFNMKVLHSRPLKNKQWQYYFYVEIEGNINSEKGRGMTKELEDVCSLIKISGPDTRDDKQ